jgi:hypothetical protein
VNAARTANESVPSTISGPFAADVSEFNRVKGWCACATPLPRIDAPIKNVRTTASNLRMCKDYLSSFINASLIYKI